MHLRAQVAGVPFGNAGDQVAGAGQGQRGGKAADGRNDLPLQAERIQGFINGPLFLPPPGHQDMPAARIARGCDLALAQRMALAHDADETVSEQRLRAHLRTYRACDNAGFQVDRPVAKRAAVLVGLLHEAKPYAGRLLAHAGNEVRSEILHEAFAGAQRERAHQLSEVGLPGRAQNSFRVLHQLADPIAQLKRSRCGNETPPGPDQQRIAGGLTQPRQRPAHCRRAQPQPLGRARNVSLRKEHIQGDKQVEIGLRHGLTVAQRVATWRQTHE